MSTLIAPRASQLEAYHLDRSFESIIDQYVENFQPPLLSDEVKLFFKTYVVFYYSRNGTTIGMSTYKMKLCSRNVDNVLVPSNDKIKLVLLWVCNLVLPYLHRKNNLQYYLNLSLYKSVKLSWLNTDNLYFLIKVLNLMVFGLFLRNGQHLLIQDKILNLSSAIDITDIGRSNANNKAQMEFMNREEIWRIIADFSLTVVPLINLNIMKEYIKRPFKTPTSSVDLSSRMFHSNAKQACAICNTQPFNPYMIGCRHIFCYYCVQTKHLTDLNGAYSCPKCNYETQDTSQVIRYKIHNTILRQDNR